MDVFTDQVATSICVDIYSPELELCQSTEARATKELLHSTASILQYSTREGIYTTCHFLGTEFYLFIIEVTGIHMFTEE